MKVGGGLSIRPARREDLAAIVALLADDPLGATREEPGPPLPEAYEAAFEAIAAQAGNVVLVAERDGAVVGCLQLTLIPGLSLRGTTRAQIEGVRVAASCRGQGIGEALIADALERARAGGAGLAQLTTNSARTEARRFYERLGFTASHYGMKRPLDGR